ncbi:serine/threonine-protein kinase [Sandaracinus amylolyticus]|nr:serine/threonine-protein kinase [Sandaracinus amylolyticus]
MLAPERRTPDLPRPPARVDRYELVAEVAQGGMAMVYAARRRDLHGFDKLLALKLLLPHLAREDRFVDMFRDELRIAARIQHANVVQVFDVGEHDGMPFMVMEYLRGRSFASVLQRCEERREDVPRELVIAVIVAVAEGLHAAHEAKSADGEPLGVVHRDVSPQNVHLGFDGQIKVVDFGIAEARGRLTSTRTGEVKGKMAYLAPEQIHRERTIDRRTDLWALGVMAWEALTGRRLFRADTDATTMWNVMHATIPDLRAVAPDVPDAVADQVMACLERDMDLRPASAAEIVRALDAPDRWRAAAIASWMSASFADEKARDEDALAKVLASPPIVDAPVATPRRASVGLVAAALVVLGAGGIAAWAALSSAAYGDTPATSPPVVEAAPVIAPAPPQAPPLIEAPPAIAEPAPVAPEPPRARRARSARSSRERETESAATPPVTTAPTPPRAASGRAEQLLGNPY